MLGTLKFASFVIIGCILAGPATIIPKEIEVFFFV